MNNLCRYFVEFIIIDLKKIIIKQYHYPLIIGDL